MFVANDFIIFAASLQGLIAALPLPFATMISGQYLNKFVVNFPAKFYDFVVGCS